MSTRYTDEFKNSAVALIEKGLDIKEVSIKTGASDSIIRKWVREIGLGQTKEDASPQQKITTKKHPSNTPEQLKINRLIKKNEMLIRENEALKALITVFCNQ